MKKVSVAMRAGDWFGSLAGFLIVLGALVAVDDRVGYQVRVLLSHSPRGEVHEVGTRLQTLAQAIVTAARDQSIDHAPMLVFTAVAVVLVFFMLRT
jgi:hypothetical protein